MQLRPIGWFHHTISRNFGVKLFRLAFGIEDFHTHLRWNGIRSFLDYRARKVLEVGANSGIMTFHFSHSNPSAEFYASEFDIEALAAGEEVQENFSQFKNIQFSSQDLREFKSEIKFDQILLIDVLEHIHNDVALLTALGETLTEHGSLLVSVPTPRYPIVFGREFHDAIGHVRDGYTLDDLRSKLKSAGFEVLDSHFHTNVFNSFFCSFFYKNNLPNRLKWLLMTLLIPLIWFSELFQGRKSAGLAVLAHRLP